MSLSFLRSVSPSRASTGVLLATSALLFPMSLPPLLAQSDPAPVDSIQATPAARRVDVKVLGAKGDGKTDDTAAFEAGIKAISEQGGVLYIPEGNYRITRRLLVGGSHPNTKKPLDYIEIVGAGKNATRLLGDGVDYILGAAHVTNQREGSKSFGERTIIHGLTIRDLTFSPYDTGKEGRCGGIDVSYMIRWSVRNCQFVGLTTGIYSLDRAKMPDAAHDALAVYIIRIHDNLFYGCSDYAIKLGRIFDLSIENNEIEHGTGGIRVGVSGDGFDAAANNIRIVNNIIEGLGGKEPAIGGSCWIGSRIIGNYFEANQGGDIELTPGSKDGWSRSNTIASNTFQPTKAQRASGNYGAIKLTKALDTIISGNFTTGANLLHPESSDLGRGVNLISNTLNNPPEIGDIKGARHGNPADYLGKLNETSWKQAEQWTVTSPIGAVGIHSLYGLRFEPQGSAARSIAYATAPPQEKERRYQAGDLLFNLNPVPTSGNKMTLGWVCVESGSPGSWKTMLVETAD